MLILLYNKQWDRPFDQELAGCDFSCTVTLDRSLLAKADAVVFHVPTMGRIDRLRKPPGQEWVAWSMESQLYYPQLLDPDFMGRFDRTMTYRLDSDIPVPYLAPEMIADLRKEPVEKTEPALAAYFVSNTEDLSGRYKYVKELMHYIDVDSYGRSLQNKKLQRDTGRETKLDVISQYAFTLAFENSITPDYISEKLFDPLIVGSIPVYLGAQNVDRFAPGEHSFINAADYSPRELAEYLRRLSGDPREYGLYLEWKQRPFLSSFQELAEIARTSPFCRLCRLLHRRKRRDFDGATPSRFDAEVAVVSGSEGLNSSDGVATGFAECLRSSGVTLSKVGASPSPARGWRSGRSEIALLFSHPDSWDGSLGRRNVGYCRTWADPAPQSWIAKAALLDLVITPSEASRQAWLAGGFPEERLRICPPGVDPGVFRPDAEPLRLTSPQAEAVLARRARFLHIADLGSRSSLMSLLRIWLPATTSADDAGLIVKLTGREKDWQVRFMLELQQLEKAIGKTRDQAAPVFFYEALLSDEGLAGLYALATHYWAVSSGSAWDSNLARAGAAGLRMMAPGHSVYQELLADSVATLVPYGPDGAWEEEAAEQLQQAIRGADRQSASARERIVRSCSWDVAGARMREILKSVKPAPQPRWRWGR